MAEILNEAAEIDAALAYVDSYVEKHPNILAPTQLPNESDDFDSEIYERSVKFLSEPYSRALSR